MNDTSTSTVTSQPKSKLGVTGWESYFDLGDDTIKVWGSSCSGLERVYLNNNLVSEKRNWRFSSSHKLQSAGHELEVKIIVVSILTGEIRLELWCDGELLDSDDLSMKQAVAGTPLALLNPKSAVSWLLYILFFAGAGAAVGFLVAFLVK